MRTFFILSLVLAAKASSLGQTISIDNDTIKWEVDSLKDVNANVSQGFSCQFITHKLALVQWVQESGSFVNDFTVNSVQGTWADMTTDGYKEFTVTYLGKSGTVRFSKAGDATEITMIFMEGDKNTTPYVFRVKSITRI